ncbi:NAD(P)-dependent oxidoreductase [Lacticaseibacillus baoqingensis]|uniref:NAD(P)-dependent oxidoreductase n=1 Tax=Lacticaseibacillus baoqingensis TaxID=2486013 RepID=A0ABW4E4K3_9LACO|nr:NAD(P)-dependent oxidoreductase [Lacticaseibacillus baoqingensis]
MAKAIVITRALKPEHVAQLQAIAPDYDFFTQWEHPVPQERLGDVEVILGGDGELTNAILDTPGNQLGFVQAHSAGVDYLDLPRLAKAKVLVANTSGIHTQPLTEYVIGAILQRTRAFAEAAANQRQHRWVHEVDYAGVAGRKMVIAGAGRIGTQIAKMATTLGIDVTGVSRSGRHLPYFDRLVKDEAAGPAFAAADFVVDLLPLTPQTHHFFDAKMLASLKPGVMFLNVGRGGTVDTAALIAAIKAGQIGHAVLDVFETEPLPADSPLWTLPNTVITPHIAGQVPHFKTVVTAIYAENLTAYLQKHQLVSHQLDLARGY